MQGLHLAASAAQRAEQACHPCLHANRLAAPGVLRQGVDGWGEGLLAPASARQSSVEHYAE